MKFSAHQDTDKGIGGLSVVSSGHIFADKGRRIYRPSGRSDYLLFYVAKGKELFYLDKEIIANDGSFIIYRPNEAQHHIYIDKNKGEFYYVHFNAPRDFDLFGFESRKVYNTTPGVELHDLFENIISELQMKQPAYEKICVSKLLNIISLLVRRTEKEHWQESKYYDKIYYVIQRMNKEYHINLSLDEYAKMCNLNKFHFLRVFREITGITPIEYRNRNRIEHAKEMLLYTNKAVNEIGTSVGYSSDSYFCDASKSIVGVSPIQYRKTGEK
jgi:AraC-like DNA-binding protein